MAKHAAPRESVTPEPTGPTGKVEHIGRFAVPDQQSVAWASSKLAKPDGYAPKGLVPLYAAATYLRQSLSEAYFKGEDEWNPTGEAYELAGGTAGEKDRRRLREATDAWCTAQMERASLHLPSLSTVYDELPLLSGALMGSAVLLFVTKMLAGDEFTFMLLIHYITMFASCVALAATTYLAVREELGRPGLLLGLAVFAGSGWVFQTLFEPNPLLVALVMLAGGIALIVPHAAHDAREKRFHDAVHTLETCETAFEDAVRSAVLNAAGLSGLSAQSKSLLNLENIEMAVDFALGHASLSVEDGRLARTYDRHLEHIVSDAYLSMADMPAVLGFWTCLIRTCLLMEFIADERRLAKLEEEQGRSYTPRYDDSDKTFEASLAQTYGGIASDYEASVQAYAECKGEADTDALYAPVVYWYARALAALPQLGEDQLAEAELLEVPYALGVYYAQGKGIAQQRDLAFELLDWSADHTTDSGRLLAISRVYYHTIRDYSRLARYIPRIVRYELELEDRQEYDFLAHVTSLWQEYGVKE